MRGDDGGHLGEHLKYGGPGRPPGSLSKVTKHRALILEAMNDEAELAIWDKMIELASGGDIAAARVCMEYSYGKPKQVHEVEGNIGLQHVEFTVAPMSQDSETTDDGKDVD